MRFLPLLLAAVLAVPRAAASTARPPSDAPTVPRDTALPAARAALAAGRPWQASRLLAPVLRDSLARTPEAELLGATAAAQWGGWREVERILRGARWLDTAFDGQGHELLTRANLGLRRDTVALRHARAAVRAAPSLRVRAERQVLLARAHDRLQAADSAAANYLFAVRELPAIGDWLRLRAVGTTRDSALRRERAAAIADSLARARLPLMEAQALERTGDTLRAIAQYDSAGSPVAALRLRAAGADAAGRAAVRAELVGLVRDRSGSPAARAAVRLLDSLDVTLSPAEQLLVARSAARGGPLARAADAYAAAIAGGGAAAADRFEYANVLFRMGRYADAVRWYRRVTAPATLAASAAYREARSYVRDGRLEEGKALLRRLVRSWPRDTAAAQALYLLADLSTDAQQDSAARAVFRRVVREHGASRLAPGAAFRAALIAYVAGDPHAAAHELDSLRRRWPTSDEVPAALYWAGRAWADVGDSAEAATRWRAAMAWDSTSYYAEASARRLGVPPWTPVPAADVFVPVPELDSAADRADLLERLGMDDEAAAERQRVSRLAAGDAERLLAGADVMRRHGRASQAILLARRAQGAGAPRDARLYRLLFPLSYEDALKAEAVRHGLDPTLVAALIRQESMFDAEATSVAGARGLMQVMPEVGRQVARGLSYAVWDPVLLYQPDVNLELGTAHLRELLDRQGNVVEVLAAYNAGAHRVARWRTKLGADDPELLAERIPYAETRDYVRIVQRNRALYRALYAWPATLTP